MPTPVRAFYGAGAAGECPLTVREGRAWLTKAFAQRPIRVCEPAQEAPLDAEAEAAIDLREVWFRYEKDSPDVLRGVDLQGSARQPVCHRGRQRRGQIYDAEGDLRRSAGRIAARC